MRRPSTALLMIFAVAQLTAIAFVPSSSACEHRKVVVALIESRTNSFPTRTLKPADFRVSYGRNPAKVAAAELWQNPSGRVVILLDMSGSMAPAAGSDRWTIARAMALAFVSWAPPQEQIWLVTFNDAVQQRFAPSDGHKAIEDWLNVPAVREGKENKGRTAELQAISAATKMLSPPQPGDAIYIITDGGDNSSKIFVSQVERELFDSGTRLFAYLLWDRYRSSHEEQMGVDGLTGLAQESGGFIVFQVANFQLPYTTPDLFKLGPKVMQEMQDATVSIQAVISHFYLLTIEGVEPSPKPKPWTIELVDEQGHKWKNLSLSYPRRPAACGQ